MAEVEQILNRVLPQIAVENNFVDYDLQVEPISSGGANYTSILYNVTIKEGTNTHDLFVKVAAWGEKIRSQSPRFYSTEIFVYTKLAKVYEALENDHKIPQEHRLILPKFYGCNPIEYEETVVLENLVKKGYQAFDRFISIDWEYAASAMTELAKIHALSFAYSKYYPQEFNKVFHDLKFEWNMENGALVEFYNMISVKAIDTVHEKAKEALKRFFDMYRVEKFTEIYQTSRKPVLVHGDFRPSNLMHRIRDDGKVDIKVVDLQTMQGSSPVIDLLYFLLTGSDAQFREQYFEKLLDHYYTELHAAMERFDLDPEKVYSRADFDYELKEKLPFGLVIAAFTLPIVTISEEDAPEVNKDMDISSFSMKKTSNRYAELLNGVVNDYIKWGVLKL